MTIELSKQLNDSIGKASVEIVDSRGAEGPVLNAVNEKKPVRAALARILRFKIDARDAMGVLRQMPIAEALATALVHDALYHEDEEIRIRCRSEILDRAEGKPAPSQDIEDGYIPPAINITLQSAKPLRLDTEIQSQ